LLGGDWLAVIRKGDRRAKLADRLYLPTTNHQPPTTNHHFVRQITRPGRDLGQSLIV
jgi:hypothetical protein